MAKKQKEINKTSKFINSWFMCVLANLHKSNVSVNSDKSLENSQNYKKKWLDERDEGHTSPESISTFIFKLFY